MSNLTVKGNASGTGTVILEAPNTNSNRTITLPDSTSTLATTADVAAIATGPTLGTAVASTSGTAIDFTGIPSTAKRVTVLFDGVSTSGTSAILTQLGDSGGVEASSYNSLATTAGGLTATSTAGLLVEYVSVASLFRTTLIVISKISGNSWISSSVINYSNGQVVGASGSKTLSDTLDRVRITTVNGTDTFDAGTINISWE